MRLQSISKVRLGMTDLAIGKSMLTPLPLNNADSPVRKFRGVLIASIEVTNNDDPFWLLAARATLMVRDEVDRFHCLCRSTTVDLPRCYVMQYQLHSQNAMRLHVGMR